jgi:hypothetical protein
MPRSDHPVDQLVGFEAQILCERDRQEPAPVDDDQRR